MATSNEQDEVDEQNFERTGTGYEYLDHTADVQLHAWGDSLKESFELVTIAMFGYMTDIETVEQKDKQTISVDGHDLESLLFKFMDEFLFLFSAEPFFIASKIEITKFDTDNFVIEARAFGEEFDISKHPQGTEVKAITYSAMQIYPDKSTHDVFVVIDI